MIPYFVKTLREGRSVNLTHIDMTRFWIPLDWAVKYLIRTYPDAYVNQAMIPPTMKAAPLIQVVDCLAELMGIGDYETVITGIRPGEKVHEAIRSAHSPFPMDSKTSTQYSRAELMVILEPFVGVR